MSSSSARYWPGLHTGIRHGETTLLAAVVPGGEASLDLLEVMAAGGGADAVLDALFRRGFGAAPDFVLVEQEPAQGGRVLARGAGRVELADGTVVTGAGVFADQRVDTVEGALLSLGQGPVGHTIPAGEGIVPANGWSLGAPDRVPLHTPHADPAAEPDARADASTPESPEQAAVGAPAYPVDPVPGGSAGTTEATPAGEAEADLSTYLDLLNPTTAGKTEPNLPAQQDADPHPSSPAPVPEREGAELAPSLGESASPAVVASPPPAPGSPFIDSVPFLDALPTSDHGHVPPPTSGLAPPPPVQPVAAPDPQVSLPVLPAASDPPRPAPAESGRTVSRAEIRRQAAATQQTVVARRCASGHLTQAYLPTCRVCGGPVAEQPDVTVPRPPLGRLVLPDGQAYLLDRPVVLGRDPREPGRPVEGIPHLVKIVDPRSEVSSQHALVTLDFWAIEVTDLGSTNGTEVVTPDGRRRRLVSGEPAQVEPGAVLVLAEILEIRVEVAP